jgi:hypothetical protein
MELIDTLAMYKKLKAAGIKPKHAEAITRAIALAHTARSNELAAAENDKVRYGVPVEG